MKTLSLISLLIVSLLLVGCILQPPPERGAPTFPAETSTSEMTNTPMPDLARTPPPDPAGTPISQSGQSGTARDYPRYAAPPPMTIDPDGIYLALIRTNKGDITLELFASEAPQTVNNFLFLAREGYYEGVSFHRIIKDFMVQTGDPTGTGAGGPGYRFADEPVSRIYTKGIVAMANAGPDTNGSQFFIVHGAEAPLRPRYTIFGQVTQGLDTVDVIAATPVERTDRGELSSPTELILIESIEITEP